MFLKALLGNMLKNIKNKKNIQITFDMVCDEIGVIVSAVEAKSHDFF